MPYSEYELKIIFDKTGGYCYHCRKKLAWRNYGRIDTRGAWEVDHSNPRARGGTDYLRNLVPSCIPCNRAKGDQTTRKYQEKIIIGTVYQHPERFPELFQKQKKITRKPSFGLSIADAQSQLPHPTNGSLTFGAYVGSVRPNSAAMKAGLQPGDIITWANGRYIVSAKEFENFLKRKRKGSHLTLWIKRGEKTLQVTAKK